MSVAISERFGKCLGSIWENSYRPVPVPIFPGAAMLILSTCSDPRNICEKCEEGFALDADSLSCLRKQCWCNFGSAAVGGACPRHKTQKCLACDPGYKLTNDGEEGR